MVDLLTGSMRGIAQYANKNKKFNILHTLIVGLSLVLCATPAGAAITTGYSESFEAGVLPTGWVMSSGASVSWEIDSVNTTPSGASDGSVSLRSSGVIPPNFSSPGGTAAIEFADTFSGGHLLVFDVFYKPTTLANNFYVYLDGEQKLLLLEGDVTTDWRTYSVHIPAGQHTVKFENKVRWDEDTLSAAWIDNLRFIDTSAFATTPGNLLVATGSNSLNTQGYLYEYDSNGLLQWEIPLGPIGSGVSIGDVVFTGQRQIGVARRVENGANVDISLDVVDPATLNISTLSMAPAVQMCCGSQSGGLTVLDNRLFAASWDSSGGTDVGGIVTRDLGATSTQVHNVAQPYRHVSIGLDNLLYALRARSDSVDVFDPTSMVIQKTITLPATSSNDYQAVTANANSDLFVVKFSFSSSIEKFVADVAGNYTSAGTLNTQKSFSDIDINANGRVVAAGGGSAVLITDEALSFATEFWAEGNQYGGDAKVGLVKISIVDTDGDGMPDSWETAHGLDMNVNDAAGDLDSDLLLNLDEYLHQADPQNVDTDSDGLQDGPEVHDYGSDPIKPDSDDDLLMDGDEVALGTLILNPDTDGDTLLDGDEVHTYGSNPKLVDSDGDGLTDPDEVNIHGTNPASADSDTDNMPDKWEIDNGLNPNDPADAALDPDTDNLSNLEEFQNNTLISNPDTDSDGLTDGEEVKTYLTLPTVEDSDGDGVLDGLEILAGLDPNNNTDAGLDSDGDGLINLDELLWGTDINNIDTDSDRLSDGDEVHVYQTQPTVKDSDGDQLTDGAEVLDHLTDPNKKDSDGDGLSDGEEVNALYPTNPNKKDSDDDGLSDGDEVNLYGTRADLRDTDGDGLTDGEEIAAGLNPLVPNTSTIDTDNDGMPDVWETAKGFDPQDPSDASQDADGDGVSNLDEYLAGTDPKDLDSDKDGMDNAWERLYGLDHEDNADAAQDADSDGLSNLGEYQAGTDPNKSDSDEDGMPDGWEVTYNLNPLDKLDAGQDPDGDGRSNLVEFTSNTDPRTADTQVDQPDKPAGGNDGGGGAFALWYWLLLMCYIGVRRYRRSSYAGLAIR